VKTAVFAGDLLERIEEDERESAYVIHDDHINFEDDIISMINIF